MALSATATRVFNSGTLEVSAGAWGIVSQADGSYVFGYQETSMDFPFPSTGFWLRSTDDGKTWHNAGTSPGLNGQMDAFPSNIRSDIICAPYWIPATLASGIIRTTNHGSTWASVFLATQASSPNGRSVRVNGVQSYDRTRAIAWGALDGNNANTPMTYGISNDAGATWTPQATWDEGDPFDELNAIGIAANGTFYAQYTKFSDLARRARLARTTNYAATWQIRSTMGSIASPPFPVVNAICCFDNDNIALAGGRGDIPTTANPGVWWSNDGGLTTNVLSASDIAGWPSPSGQVQTREVKRLTRDAAILAFDVQTGVSSGSCWAISQDKGHTYPITVAQGPGADLWQIPFGKIVITKTGTALMSLWQSPDYNSAHVSVWRAPILC